MESDQFKNHRRTAMYKHLSFLELLSKSGCLPKLSPAHTKMLVDDSMASLTTSDSQLQKFSLACLLKCSKKAENSATVKLPKYAKLLEGLLDDNKFKDMLLVVQHGQNH
jgi:hypothetical protein